MQYTPADRQLNITVTELVSLFCRRGGLSRRNSTYISQKSTDKFKDELCESHGESCDFDSELSTEIEYNDITFIIDGTCDIVVKSADGFAVELPLVIGGGKPEPSFFDPQRAVLRCLASLFCSYYGKEKVSTRLVVHGYGDCRSFTDEETLTADIAAKYLRETIEKALPFINFEIERHEFRIPAEASIKFPYEIKRQGQRDMINEAYAAIVGRKRLFAEAPTGTGKTVAALYPAIRALGKGKCNKVFYLTPKTTAQTAASETVKLLCGGTAAVRSIVITAKDRVCPYSRDKLRADARCDACPRAATHFERAPIAVLKLLSEHPNIRLCDVQSVATEYNVCPYELSLDASEYCDVVICDYNYLFDARAYLRRYFDSEKYPTGLSSFVDRSDYVFLLDEAHNLPDRARNMYSDGIYEDALRELREDLNDKGFPDVKAEIDAILARFPVFSASCEENVTYDDNNKKTGYFLPDKPDAPLYKSLAEIVTKVEAERRKNLVPIPDKLLDFFFAAKEFISKSSHFCDKFKLLYTLKDDVGSYRLLCLDPSDIVDSRLSLGKAAVLFSATLSPADYYMRILGCRERGMSLVLPSPFSSDMLSVSIMKNINTRYESRTASAYEIVQTIITTISAQRGNYMIFFPSYGFLDEILKLFRTAAPSVDVLVQTRNMSVEQRAEFIARFDENNEHTLVGFCVLGGVYAEAIDLIGKKLIGAVAVSVGLPKLSLERNILCEYYNGIEEDGYSYSYVYPGFTRVLQAAGRVIRSENDRGVVVLVDERFATPQYVRLLPAHLRHAKLVETTDALARVLSNFWSK